MNNYSPEGQELLQGLYMVKEYLDKANEKYNEFWKFERVYRGNVQKTANSNKMQFVEKIGLLSPKDRFSYILFVVGIIFSVASLLFGNIISFIFISLITVLFMKGKIKKNKKNLFIGGILIILMILDFTRTSARQMEYFSRVGNYATIYFGIFLILLIVAIVFFISLKLLKKYNINLVSINQKIAEYNHELDLKRQEISAEINAIHKEMLDRSEAWFPPDYYSLDAVEQFISYVRNHRADTVKEMMTVYDTSNYRNESLRNQQEINEKLSQSINNQEQMMAYQRQANALLVGNLIANVATSINTGEIARNTRETASHSATIAREAQAMSRRIGADRYNSF